MKTYKKGKTCIRCKEVKSITQFYLSKAGYYSSYCRLCHTEMARERRPVFIPVYSETYNAIHKWLYSRYGNATHCDNDPSHKGKRFDWSLIHGKEYTRNRENFRQLCPSCHIKYDTTDNKRRVMRQRALGNRWSADARLRKKEALYA